KTAPKKYGSDRPELEKYYTVYRSYAQKNNLPLVDNYPVWLAMQQQEPERYKKAVSDGIHPHSGPSRGVTGAAVTDLMKKSRQAVAGNNSQTSAP
ncbi:MAG: hypothetical protein ACK5LK_10950, partial [Chthoniobacterales bacterium]